MGSRAWFDARLVEPRPRWWGLSLVVLLFLAVGLTVRLLWVAVHPVDPVSDFALYHKNAATLAEHGAYGPRPGVPDAYWAPGWPVVLAVFYVALGAHPQAAAVLGAILDWAAIVVAAGAASRLLRPAFAAGAVAGMCFYPGALAYSPVLGTEHLTALLFTGVVVLLGFARPSIRTALVAGLLEGALLLTRPEFGVAMAAVIAVWVLRSVPARRIPALAAVTAAGILACVGPWIVRNAVRFGEFIPTASKGGLTFYLGTLAPRYTEPAIVDRLGVTSTIHPAAHDRRYWRLGLKKVAEDPLRWVALDVRRIYHQYGEETSLLNWGEIESPTVRGIAYAYWLAIVGLGLVGFGAVIAARRRLHPAWLVIAGSILAVSLLKLGFVVNQRDRLPLTYLLIVIAGLGAQRLVEAGSTRARLRSSAQTSTTTLKPP